MRDGTDGGGGCVCRVWVCCMMILFRVGVYARYEGRYVSWYCSLWDELLRMWDVVRGWWNEGGKGETVSWSGLGSGLRGISGLLYLVGNIVLNYCLGILCSHIIYYVYDCSVVLCFRYLVLNRLFVDIAI